MGDFFQDVGRGFVAPFNYIGNKIDQTFSLANKVVDKAGDAVHDVAGVAGKGIDSIFSPFKFKRVP